jgi:hypothetical protein
MKRILAVAICLSIAAAHAEGTAATKPWMAQCAIMLRDTAHRFPRFHKYDLDFDQELLQFWVRGDVGLLRIKIGDGKSEIHDRVWGGHIDDDGFGLMGKATATRWAVFDLKSPHAQKFFRTFRATVDVCLVR